MDDDPNLTTELTTSWTSPKSEAGKLELESAPFKVRNVFKHLGGSIQNSTSKDSHQFTGLHPDGRLYEAQDWPLYRAMEGEPVINEDTRCRFPVKCRVGDGRSVTRL